MASNLNKTVLRKGSTTIRRVCIEMGRQQAGHGCVDVVPR
jgi:hypothetical protein